MFYLRMINVLMVLSLGSAVIVGEVYAASSPTDAAGDVKPDTTKQKLSKEVEILPKVDLGTKIPAVVQADVDPQESLPMQANIVVWREAEVSAPKNILKFSALNDSLTPTDRDRLAGEVQYGSVLTLSFNQQ